MPESRAVRQKILARAAEVASGLDKTRPLARQVIEGHARSILGGLGEAEDYAGWTMVMLGSEFWRGQVAAVPCDRRLLLLPHCLRDAEKCPAKYTALLQRDQKLSHCKLIYLKGLGSVLLNGLSCRPGRGRPNIFVFEANTLLSSH